MWTEKLHPQTQQDEASPEFKQVAGFFFAGQEVPEAFESMSLSFEDCYKIEYGVGDHAKVFAAKPLDDWMLKLFLYDCIMSNDFVKASTYTEGEEVLVYGLQPIEKGSHYLNLIELQRKKDTANNTVQRQISDGLATEDHRSGSPSMILAGNSSVTSLGRFDPDIIEETTEPVSKSAAKKQRHRQNKKKKAVEKALATTQEEEAHFDEAHVDEAQVSQAQIIEAQNDDLQDESSDIASDVTDHAIFSSAEHASAVEEQQDSRVNSEGSWMTVQPRIIQRGSTQVEPASENFRTNGNGDGRSSNNPVCSHRFTLKQIVSNFDRFLQTASLLLVPYQEYTNHSLHEPMSRDLTRVTASMIWSHCLRARSQEMSFLPHIPQVLTRPILLWLYRLSQV